MSDQSQGPLTVAHVDQIEAELRAAKASNMPQTDPDGYRDLMQRVAEARSNFRAQEEAAGRRTGLVGGDAAPTTG